MQTKKFDGTDQRIILTGMIVDPIVLGRISPKWNDKLFENDWCNLIGSWCVKYFNRHSKAPHKTIERTFRVWAESNNQKETVDLVDRFLTSLSSEYKALAKDSNSQHVIDVAIEYFNKVRLRRLADEITDDLEAGKIEKAHKRVTVFDSIEMGISTDINPLTQKDAIKMAFESKREPLITYPGALGNFFGEALERDAFVALMGPEKRGKTWWLLDIAWNAVKQGRRVAFFEVGDMSQNQIMRRLMVRVSGRPLKACKIKIPKWIERDPEQEFAQVDYDEREFKKDLDWQTAWKGCINFLNAKINKIKGGELFKLACYPNSTMSILGIQSCLQHWERQGWIPDVIVIDYADILAPLPGYTESRDQINATWKGLRAMSQSLHCLVVTATQSDAASYKAETIDRSHFSEDKRKLAHITGMIGLNATKDEKVQGVMRLNWLALREGEFSEDKCVHVAGCLALANPAIKSTF